MTNKKTINKYDELYASSMEFTFRINVCKRGEVEGASDDEILEFCNDNNITLPPPVWSYARYFGKKSRIRNSNYNYAHTLADCKYALYQANLREEWHEMMNVKELLQHKNFKVNYDYDYPEDSEGLYTPEINSLMNVNDILPFSYDEFARSFKFLDSTKENPETFYLTKYYSLSSTFLSLTNRYRDLLFVNILNAAPQGFAEMGLVNGKRVPISAPPVIDYSDGFECLKIYQEIFKNENLNRRELSRLREEFYSINNEVEAQEDRILSFTEFENNFIKYLKENNLN